MKINKSLSIIIPFCNVEKYFHYCLESVYNQNIPEDDYEVICVNDCSTDNSCKIALEFQEKHTNLKLIQHTTRLLAGGARNTGLRAATGKYIWFIDSDDYIRGNILSELLALVSTTEADILQFAASKVDEKNVVSKISEELFQGIDGIMTGIEYLTKDNNYIAQVWNKWYLRNFLFSNNLVFRENCFWEDADFSHKAYLSANSVVSYSENIYFYRSNADSYTRNFEEKGNKIADAVASFIENRKIFEKYKSFPFFKRVTEVGIYVFTNISAKGLLYLPVKEKIKYYKRVKKIDRNLCSEYLPLKQLIFITYPLLIFFPFKLWRILRKPLSVNTPQVIINFIRKLRSNSHDNYYNLWKQTYSPKGKLPWDENEPEPWIMELHKQGKIGGKVLDIGCGPGRNTLYLVQQGYNVTAADISDIAINRVKEKIRENDGKAKLICADMSKKTLRSNYFDTIFDIGCYHSMEGKKRKQYVTNLHKMCRNRGVLYLRAHHITHYDGQNIDCIAHEDITNDFLPPKWQIENIFEKKVPMLTKMPDSNADAWFVEIKCRK